MSAGQDQRLDAPLLQNALEESGNGNIDLQGVSIKKSCHAKHLVSQAYCSALPVAYTNHSPNLWEPFARLVLEASYEATILAAILNARGNGNNRLFLTLLGGGVFGNETDWIVGGIERALNLYKEFELDVAIVSYGSSQEYVRQLVDRFSK